MKAGVEMAWEDRNRGINLAWDAVNEAIDSATSRFPRGEPRQFLGGLRAGRSPVH